LAKWRCLHDALCGINSPFGELSPTSRQVAHVLRTLAPLNTSYIAARDVPFDLHVLSTPPAFVLSQNQTLHKKVPCDRPLKASRVIWHFHLPGPKPSRGSVHNINLCVTPRFFTRGAQLSSCPKSRLESAGLPCQKQRDPQRTSRVTQIGLSKQLALVATGFPVPQEVFSSLRSVAPCRLKNIVETLSSISPLQAGGGL
jgi:hypothetical protein